MFTGSLNVYPLIVEDNCFLYLSKIYIYYKLLQVSVNDLVSLEVAHCVFLFCHIARSRSPMKSLNIDADIDTGIIIYRCG